MEPFGDKENKVKFVFAELKCRIREKEDRHARDISRLSCQHGDALLMMHTCVVIAEKRTALVVVADDY